MKHRIIRWLRYFLPVRCVGCASPQHDLICTHCRETILGSPRCEAEVDGIDRTIGFFVYEGPLKSLIHEAKFGPSMEAATMLSEIVIRRGVERSLVDYDWIIPIPGSRDRIRYRGFDLPKLLFTPLMVVLRTRLLSVMIRTRDTHALFGLGVLARRDELAGVFSVPPGLIRPGDTVLLVDDIVTSGATVQEAARYLKMQGALRVDVMAVAMTPKGQLE